MTGRRKRPSHLPARVYEKFGSWHFVDIDRKWHKLCRVSDGLCTLYTELAKRAKIDDSDEAAKRIPAIIGAWRVANSSRYTVRTRLEYERMSTFISEQFEQFRADQVRPCDIATFLDHHFPNKPAASNRYRTVLSTIFAYAIRKGLCDINPVRDIKCASEAKRDRYIADEEVAAIRAAALVGRDGRPTFSGAMIVCLIDLACQTAQRISDLLALRWENLSKEGIYFRPAKTVNSSGVRMLIEMSPELQKTLDAAKAGKIQSLYVIHTKKGQRMTYSGAQTGWKRAKARALENYRKDCMARGVEPIDSYLQDCHFHDLRAKALTDIRRAFGQEAAQRLAGHTTAEMTAHYTKSREIERVTAAPLNSSRNISK